MDLQHISLDRLRVASVNARVHGADQSLDTLAASIQAVGLLQPLLVRPYNGGDTYEIVAGQRRYLACQRLAEQQPVEPLPCLVLDATDDATALEASLAENLERLPMQPLDQHEAFARLIKEGRTVDDIAAHFGVTERLVKQRLALAHLIEPIKQAAREERIPVSTLQTLTLGTPKQQKDWWKLFKSRDHIAPQGRSLKEWLLGGATIATSVALFPLETYTGQIITDLFGEDHYFADPEAFWACQRQAIAERREALLAQGWARVEALTPGKYFHPWEHERVAQKDGGWVFIESHPSGEVRFHEGYRPMADHHRAVTGDDAPPDAAPVDPPARSELTHALQNYVALHKQAAVRAELSQAPALALRLAVACLITGATNWQVTEDPTPPDRPAIGESVQTGQAQAERRRQREAARALLGLEPDPEQSLLSHVPWGWGETGTATVLARLLTLMDAEVMQVLAAAVAEALSATGGLLELIGARLGIDMRRHWTPDDTFFELARDKAALAGMVTETGGEPPRQATIKDLQALLRRRLDGAGCTPVTAWLPRYLAFPPGQYTARPASDSAQAYARLAPLLAPAADNPPPPDAT